LNVVKATVIALSELQDPVDIANRRGLPVDRVQPFWSRGNG
jgi:ribosomal protein S5